MRNNTGRDIAVGLFVIASLAAIAYLALQLGGLSFGGEETMRIYANFDEIGGLKPRAPVVVAGVRVGQVDSIGLAEDYRARVAFDVESRLELPVDSSASIVTSGVLGDRYISLQLGGDDLILADGDDIEFVESAVVLERLIGQLIHNTNIDSSKE